MGEALEVGDECGPLAEVRALLVPATMRLLGRANWWARGAMRR